MSLTKDRLDAALSEVRVSPELHRRVMRGLHKQPHRSIQSRRALVACAVALLVILFSVFAAPPIVRAAGQWFERFFGGRLLEIEEYEALPTDAKFQQELEALERYSMTFPMEASARIHDTDVKLGYVSTYPDSQGDPRDEQGHLSLWLLYSKIPPFDPSYTDFTLNMDGTDVPMAVDAALAQYRAKGGRTLTKAEWEANGRWDVAISGSNSSIMGYDKMQPGTSVIFPMARWKIDQPTQCVLRGAIGGEALEIPFVLDPQAAHEYAIEEAERSMAWRDEQYAQEKQKVEQATKGAVLVGITKRAGDVELTLENLSYTKGTLMLTTTIKGASSEHGFPTVDLDCVAIDGVDVIDGSGHNAVWEGDLMSLSSEFPLSGKRPKESLIYIATDDEKEVIQLAFKYRWKEKKVILPEDEAEEAEWIAQGQPKPLE